MGRRGYTTSIGKIAKVHRDRQKSEIRMLRDQLRLMIRTGFDAIVIDQADAEAVYDFSSHEFSEFYQSAADTADSIFVKRQRARQSKAAE